jgi:hypothetical protein
MGKIFLPPKGFKSPDIRKYTSTLKKSSINEYFKDCEKYVDKIKKTVRDSFRAECPEAGEEIRFPEGEGYARYIIARLKPVELIWIDVGDQWQYRYAHRLTATDIRKELKNNKALRAMFS